MKSSFTGILTLLAGACVVHGQGAVSFANYGALYNYIYVGYKPATGGTGAVLLGGSNTGPPPTLTNYADESGDGNDWTVQLYGAIGANLSSSVLSPLPGMTATFANWVDDATAGTWYSTAVATFSNAPAGTIATLQLYAWYNAGGTITNYSQALNHQVPIGFSTTANVTLAVPAAALPDLGNFILEYLPETGPPMTPMVTWTNPAAITYGTALGASQLDAVASVPGTYVYNPPIGKVLNTGSNTLSVEFTPYDTQDYYDVFTNTSILVTPAPLTVTASNQTWVEGQPFPALTGAITGVTNGDNITAVFSSSATTNSPVGTYPIVPSLVDPDDRRTNYTVSLVNGTLTIFSSAAPVLQALPLPNGALSLIWTTPVGGMYQLQYTSDLSSSYWTNLGSALAANGPTLGTTNFTTNAPQRFYRVLLLP